MHVHTHTHTHSTHTGHTTHTQTQYTPKTHLEMQCVSIFGMSPFSFRTTHIPWHSIFHEISKYFILKPMLFGFEVSRNEKLLYSTDTVHGKLYP